MNTAATLISNTISYICLTALVSSNEVLQWVYTVIFAISVLFPIIWNIVNSAKDGNITKDEVDEIKKKVDEAEKKLKDIIDKSNGNKEDK